MKYTSTDIFINLIDKIWLVSEESVEDTGVSRSQQSLQIKQRFESFIGKAIGDWIGLRHGRKRKRVRKLQPHFLTISAPLAFKTFRQATRFRYEAHLRRVVTSVKS